MSEQRVRIHFGTEPTALGAVSAEAFARMIHRMHETMLCDTFIVNLAELYSDPENDFRIFPVGQVFELTNAEVLRLATNIHALVCDTEENRLKLFIDSVNQTDLGRVFGSLDDEALRCARFLQEAFYSLGHDGALNEAEFPENKIRFVPFTAN